MKLADVAQKRLRHAAERSRLSAGPLQVLQSRIRRHQLPHRSRASCARSCPSRSRWSATPSTTSSSACRIRPASATTPRPARSSRCASGRRTARCRKAAMCMPCISTTIRRSPAGARSGAFRRSSPSPKIAHESETLVCTLHYGSVLCVSATMGYKHRELDPAPLLKSLAKPNFMIKIIPHVDCTPRICELVRYYLRGRHVEGRVVRARRHPALRACHVRRRPPAGARGGLGQPLHHRPDARPRRGGVRLFEGRLACPAHSATV